MAALVGGAGSEAFGSAPAGSVNVASVCVPVSTKTLASNEKPPLAATGGSLTLTVNVLESDWSMSVSVTVIVTVWGPSSPYLCVLLANGPGLLAVKAVSDVPSPQLISTDQGPPSGSLNEPRPKTCDAPSTDVWSAGGFTVGGVAWVRISQAPQPIVPAPRR